MRRLALGLALAVAGCTTTAPSPTPPAPRGPRYDVEPVSGLGFFADERARSQQLLAAGLAQRGLDTAPMELERAWALAAEGKSPLTGQACGMPLSRYVARKRWGAALGVDASASAHVSCRADGGCELSVTGWPVAGEGDRLRLEAPFPREGEALAALPQAVAHLAPPASSQGGGGLGLIGALAGPQPIQREDTLEVTAYLGDLRADATRRAPSPAVEGLSVEQVTACLAPGDDTVSVLAEVRADGSLARCEGGDEETPADACVCGLLARAKPAAALAGARWYVSVRLDRRDQLTQDGKYRLVGSWRTFIERYRVEGEKYPRFRPKVEHPSIADWRAPPSRLTAACFTGAFPAPGRLNTRWAVWFDARGRPTRTHRRAEGLCSAREGRRRVRGREPQDGAGAVPRARQPVGEGGLLHRGEGPGRAGAVDDGPAGEEAVTRRRGRQRAVTTRKPGGARRASRSSGDSASHASNSASSRSSARGWSDSQPSGSGVPAVCSSNQKSAASFRAR